MVGTWYTTRIGLGRLECNNPTFRVILERDYLHKQSPSTIAPKCIAACSQVSYYRVRRVHIVVLVQHIVRITRCLVLRCLIFMDR